jgi:hypothetical protein
VVQLDHKAHRELKVQQDPQVQLVRKAFRVLQAQEAMYI